MQKTEIWKDIKGFEGRYQVSNMGRVKSLNYRRTGNSKIMRTSNDGRGYRCVALDGKTVKVHKLVGLTFVDGYKKGLVINHLNEKRYDNRACNLEWTTFRRNLNYSLNIHGTNKIGKQVVQKDGKQRYLAIYRSAKDVARILKIPYNNFITSLRKGMAIRNGYIFEYIENKNIFI